MLIGFVALSTSKKNKYSSFFAENIAADELHAPASNDGVFV